MGAHEILHGDVREWLQLYPDDYFDACFCDPPYLLEFMGKAFDRQHKKMKGEYANDGQRMQAWHETWAREVIRVMKPGAYMLAFGGTRTSHRLTSAAEDVGFEVEDTLQWLHGQGFPKGKTKLKPAQEPITLARKPGAKGCLAIDECRVVGVPGNPGNKGDQKPGDFRDAGGYRGNDPSTYKERVIDKGLGRWPANLILSHHEACVYAGTRRVNANQSTKPGSGKGHKETQGHGIYHGVGGVVKASTADEDGKETVEVWECHPDCPVRMLDEQSGITKSTAGGYNFDKSGNSNPSRVTTNIKSGVHFGDKGGASRFFYTAKVSPRERNLGGVDCRHPTLKPIFLTTYLSRLLLLPPNSDLSPRRLLVPFSGAGSEIAGALIAGWDEVVGVEQDLESITWAEARIPAALLAHQLGVL